MGSEMCIRDSHKTFVSARIALGAVAATPLFAEEASNILAGQPVSEESIQTACSAAQDVARPISDMRGSAEQRKHLVGVLTKRALNGAISRIKETA